MGVGKTAQPSKLVSIEADDGGIGHSTLAEVEFAVRPKGDHIGMVVARSW